jgi:hypothetical protein
MKKVLIVTFCSFFISFSTCANQVEWKVKKPFRFIKDDQSNRDFVIADKSSALEFISNRMSKRDRTLLPPFDKTYWDPNVDSDKRLSEDYIYPEKQTVMAKLVSSADGECVWQYQTQSLQADCSKGFSFEGNTQFAKGSPKLSVKLLSTNEEIVINVVVRDRLILGLGDSYASGEGNPDIPTLVSNEGIASLAKKNKNSNTTGRWMRSEHLWVAEESSWLDRQCHRSFFSQQILASLKLSSKNPHETITVVPLACSGAEILDGLLIPQKSPPGGGRMVKDSQVNFAVKHLCRNGSLHSVNKIFYRGYTGNNQRRKESQEMFRCDGELRKPDAIFLNVGGNDVGFAPSIAWATLPNGYRHLGGLLAVNITHKAIKPVCPKETGQKVCSKNKPVGKIRIKDWLPDYYNALSEQLLETGLIDNPNKVYFTAYPNPTFIEDGSTLCDKDRSTDIGEQARSKLPRVFSTQRWDMGITQSEMNDLNVGLINPLYTEMKKSAVRLGWTFIDSHLPELITKGICSGYVRREKEKPIYPHIRHGIWYPADPSTIWAYDVNRPYWYRNTNDSVLFQADHTDSDMNGAFHPDFRTHALIADHLADRVYADWNESN